jgi:hypothetical protein
LAEEIKKYQACARHSLNKNKRQFKSCAGTAPAPIRKGRSPRNQSPQ